MKKVMRSFRLPADLVERFDRAAEADGVDKTEIVVQAIQQYVDLHELHGEFGDSYIHIGDIYIPELGKCYIGSGLIGDQTSGSFTMKVLNNERKDDEGYSYRIDHAMASVDLAQHTCRVTYKKVYVGGYVEDGEPIEYQIRWTARKPWQTDAVTELTIMPAK